MLKLTEYEEAKPVFRTLHSSNCRFYSFT